jgi:transposase-like protein
MKAAKVWYPMTPTGDFVDGSLEGSSLQNAFGDVYCPECGHQIDAGTGEHAEKETFECPICLNEFTIEWLEARKK